MTPSSGAGDLVITVGGDLSALETAFDQIPGLAQEAFGPIQTAIQAIDLSPLSQSADTVATSLSGLSDAAAATATGLADTGAALDAAGTSLETVANSTDDAVTATQALTPALESAAAAASDSAEASGEAASGFAEMAEQLVALGEGLAVIEVLKEFGQEALEAGAAEQSAALALQALGSSAEQAGETVESLVQMSMQLPFATADLLQTQERMQAVGIPLAQISTLMTDVAASAATMGTNLNRATMQIDNMITQGTVAATSLTRLGISVTGFVDAINQIGGPGTASIDNFATAFKQLDQSQAIQVVELAMQGLANNIQAQAESINGQLQILKNSWEAVMVDMGQAIAPTTGMIVTGLTSIIQTVQGAIAQFQTLPAPIVAIGAGLVQLAAGLGVVALAMVAFTAALGAGALALTAFNSAAVQTPLAAVSSAVTGAAVSFGEFATGLTVASGAITAATAALAALGVGIALIAGWQLGHIISDWINNITGFTAAQQKAAAETQATNAALSQNAAATQTGNLADADFATSLYAVGVGFDQLAAKGPVATTAVQSFANAVQEGATNIRNIDTSVGNTTQLLGYYKSIIDSAASSTTQIGAATTLYNAALAASVKADEDASGGLESVKDAALLAQNAFSLLQVSTANAQTTFAAVANAFAHGGATLSEYTTALTAMNKAQMDANNGIELAGTALLVAENAYRLLEVAATNAATNVAALASAVDAGQASWTQYVTALTALNKAQEDANGGLEELGTAVAMVDAAYTNLGVAFVNAQTNLEAVDQDVANGTAGWVQHVAAVNAAQAAYVKLGSGIMDATLALQQAADNAQAANISFINLNIQVQAAYANWVKTGQGLQQYLDLVAKLPGANEAANNGLLSVATASQAIAASQTSANIALTNANTMLAQAAAKYADGSISLGTYTKYLEAQKTAQDAVNGSTKTAAATAAAATTATNQLSTAATGLASSFNVAKGALLSQTDAANQVAQNYRDLGISLQNAQTWLQAVQDAYDHGTATAPQLIGALQGLKKAQDDFTGGTSGANGALSTEINSLENLVGLGPSVVSTLNNIGTASVSSFSSVSSSATAAAGAVQGLGQQLDALMGDIPGKSLGQSLDASMNAAIGSMSVTTGPNTILSTAPQGIFPLGGLTGPMDTNNGGDPFLTNHEILNSTATIQPFTKAVAAATTATTALTTATAATTTATTALTAQQIAAEETAVLTDAALSDAQKNMLLLNLAYSAAFDTTTASTTALGDQTTALVLATSAAGLSASQLNALNSAAASASTGVSSLSTAVSSTAATVGAASGAIMTSSTALIGAVNTGLSYVNALGLKYNLPTVAGAGVGGSPGGPLVNTSVPTVGANGGVSNGSVPTLGGTAGTGLSLTVNVNAGTVVGNNGMQQLSTMVGNQLVKTLGNMGIRLNRQ